MRLFAAREEITGLVLEEMLSFIEQHFGPKEGKRLCEQGVNTLFECALNAPLQTLDFYADVPRRLAIAGKDHKKIDPEQVHEALARWERA